MKLSHGARDALAYLNRCLILKWAGHVPTAVDRCLDYPELVPTIRRMQKQWRDDEAEQKKQQWLTDRTAYLRRHDKPPHPPG